MITILTPTYNRAYILTDAYDSLLRQTDKSFEWIIVDDGSTDDTESQVRSWISIGHISIRFFRKENGGKHTAINLGVQHACGELTIILDSDDYLADDAIETIRNTWRDCKKTPKSGGMVFLKGDDSTGKSMSTEFIRTNYWANTIQARHVDKIKGDKAEVYRTDILREFPFPVFETEKFLTEEVVWNRIAKRYELLHVNKIIYWAEYLEDGLTRSANQKNPFASIQGQILNLNEKTTKEFPLIKRISHTIGYIGKSLHSNSIWQTIRQSKSPVLCVMLMPLGIIKHLQYRCRNKRYDS
ncbi:MAG: glycosyltransferase family 2 protein [Thermoguttaceae bacterium]